MDAQRRRFLKWAGAVLTAGIAVSFVPYRFISSIITPDHHYLIEFQRLSQSLTDDKQLSPDLAQLYFDYLYQQQPSALTELMHQTSSLQHEDQLDEFLRRTMPMKSEPSDLLKRILKMWYYGSDQQHTISAAAYQQSLIWKPVQSTPRGVATNMHWDRSSAIIV